MDANFTDKMKQRLLSDQTRLEDELKDTKFEDVGSEEGENAYEVAQLSDKLSLGDALNKSLRDIKGALERIDAGTYGTCKYCKDEIDEQRLTARPTSSACIQCKKTLTQEV